MRKFLILLLLLTQSASILATPERIVRQIPGHSRQFESLEPRRDDPRRDPVEVISYDDDFALFLTMPDWLMMGDSSFNVRFTPEREPFRIIGLQVLLCDMDGAMGNPGMNVAVFSSDDGVPNEEVVSFEVPFENLVFSSFDEFEWNDIAFADYDIDPVVYQEITDFHIVLDVIQDDEGDTLAIFMDDGEAQPTDRSGFWNGEWEVWDLIEIVYGRGHNFALRAVVEYPDPEPPAIVVDPPEIVAEGGGEFFIRVSNAGGEILQWQAEIEIIDQPEEPEQPWIELDFQEGELEPGEGSDITVFLITDGLVGGLYEADLRFLSNDPENPVVVVHVGMDVIGGPVIDVNPEELDFGIVDDQEPRTEILTISNIGTELVIIEDISIDSEVFTTDFNNVIELGIRESTDITVTFTPNAPGLCQSFVSISSNTPENNPLRVPVHAIYILPPKIGVDPLNIESVDGGDYAMILINEGDLQLEWSTAIEAEWLSIVPSEGQNDFWEETALILSIDTTGLAIGIYQTNLIFNSNDPVTPELAVGVRLEVTGLGVTFNPGIPVKFGLNAIYPNPFNSSATVSFSLDTPGDVYLQMFDMAGHLIKNLISGTNMPVGVYKIIVDAADLPAGSYSIRLQQNANVKTQTISLIK